MTIDWPTVTTLAQTIFGEARGEGFAGMAAVAWVVRNRVEMDLGKDGKPDWWGEGYVDVCRKPFQFSCWNSGDPNLRRIRDEFGPWGAPKSQMGFECLYVALGVMLGRIADPTHAATHYCTVHPPRPDMPWPPKWAQGLSPVTTIGRHNFYRGVK